MSDDLDIVSCQFKLPGEGKWMSAISRWPMTEAEQDRRLRTKWGPDIEIRRKKKS
tara:strand:+ start:726 stop:890 length:165 start_codon:yes stop_codon:yes gene_type:complete